jgi:hypothetical protein
MAPAAKFFAIAAPDPDSRGRSQPSRRKLMGKYFLAWILGVPATVLVLIYLLMH